MATTPMLLHPWQRGQLIAKLDETQQQFGLPPKADASPPPKTASGKLMPTLVSNPEKLESQPGCSR